MMYLKLLIATSFFVSVYCLQNISCGNKICVHKCCPFGQFVTNKTKLGFLCRNYEKLNFSTVPVFDEDAYVTNKTFDSVFSLVPGKYNQAKDVMDVGLLDLIPRLTENGGLLLETPNDYQRWTKVASMNYCIDYKIGRLQGWSEKPSVRYWAMLSEGDFPQVSTQGYFRFGLFATVVFLLLTILVQLNASKLKVLYIPILMAYLTCLVIASSLLFVIESVELSEAVCISLTMSIYYFCLVTCCWMVVMSFDIWIASRDFRRSVPVNQDRKIFKFLMYCVFALGLPSFMTTAFYVLNTVDLRSWPWFITPQVPQMGCFLNGGAKILYLYVPMIILIGFNWLFSIMTACNIYLKTQKRPSFPRFSNLSS